MLRLRTLLKRSLAPAVGCALIVAACGGSSSHAATTTLAAATTAKAPTHDTKLVIYSGLPWHGPQRAASVQIQQGISFELKWAKEHHQLGGRQVVYRALDDSWLPPPPHRHGKKQKATPNTGWNQVGAVRAAEKAASNPETVAYIGDLDSGATELSLPILNQAGIVQLTPGSGYPGLTVKVPDVTSTTGIPEPDRYYPHGKGSLFRLVPDDRTEAAAATYWLKKQPSCSKLAAVAFGGNQEANALVTLIEQSATSDKLTFLKTATPGTDPKKYSAYIATQLAPHSVNCIVLAGPLSSAAIAFTKAFHAALPGADIVGTSALCNTHWTGGVSVKADPFLYCMTPALPLAKYPGGTRFASTYQAAEHRSATADTYYGYVAAYLVLQAIREIGSADSRQQVIFNIANNVTNGTAYAFDLDGDLSGDIGEQYGLDRVEDGKLRLHKVLPGS